MAAVELPADRWHSGQYTGHCVTAKLAPGQLVIADRRPFRIDRVVELPAERWPEKFVQAWRERGMPDPATWWDRPMRVTGFWEGADVDTRAYGVDAPAGHLWNVLPEHYSVCHKCLELPPCRHVHNKGIMERESERFAEQMALMPGVCHGCREPVTKRQKSFTFPGANLIRPDLGDNSALFHTRSRCYGALTAYDKQWAAAEPDRTRLFFCEGTMTVHHDGTAECDNPACTAMGALTEFVDHRCRIWHRPDDRAVERGCWCLAGN